MKMPNTQVKVRRPVRPPGMGVKNIENRRVKNRRFKIKRTMEQPRNAKVRQNGRVIRRMVVRRKTIYPGMTRRNCY